MAVDRSQPDPQEQRRGQSGSQRDPRETPIDSAMGGAGDTSSGGGAGAGIPDGETAMRSGDAATRGNVRQDRKKLFPDAEEPRKPSGAQRKRTE